MKPSKQQAITNARLLLRRSEVGVLSTHSKACDGYPFGSVSTFMSTHEGDIIFYVSDLAQHTKNLQHNAKMCLTVFSADGADVGRHSDDPNAEARLSLLGHATPIAKEDESITADRFFRLYPDSKQYQQAHAFEFYKMHIDRVRFIGGFGDIHWISESDWRQTTPEWQAVEHAMVKHMNEDHVDAMQAICAHYANVNAQEIEMLAVNPDGAFYKCDEYKPIFIAFENLAIESTEVRKTLVAQTNAARQALGINKAAV